MGVQDNFADLNLYTYCNNNSINCMDPAGTFAISAGYVVVTVLVATYIYVAGIKRTITSTKKYTVSKSYWNTYSNNKYLGHKILLFSIYRTAKLSESIKQSKGGKQNIRDSGLRDVTDGEVSKRAKDKSLPKEERERYKKEDKARRLRNQQKRKSHY